MSDKINDQVTPAETAELLRLVSQCLELDGDLVELGCYKGITSVEFGKLLAKTPKKLYLYDSFAGLPEKSPEDASGAGANFQKGELLVTKREVADRIKRTGLRNVIIKKAWFDELADHDLPEKIAFAFCDGDLYQSIKVSLQLVLPRLVEHSTIVVHDYNNTLLPGAARAVDEFLRLHPEFHLQVRHTLAIITK